MYQDNNELEQNEYINPNVAWQAIADTQQPVAYLTSPLDSSDGL